MCSEIMFYKITTALPGVNELKYHQVLTTEEVCLKSTENCEQHSENYKDKVPNEKSTF